jgi:hypothetical protein
VWGRTSGPSSSSTLRPSDARDAAYAWIPEPDYAWIPEPDGARLDRITSATLDLSGP